MSWVCDILLLCDLQELYPEIGDKQAQPKAVVNLNSWLDEREWAPFVPLHDHIGMNSEAAFQALAYGVALTRLDVPAFMKAVADQPWEAPDALVLLMKNEDETRFNVYRKGEDGWLSADAELKVVKRQGDTRMTEMLLRAAASNDVSAIRRLVEQGADPNCVSEHGHTPLHNACIARKPDAVRALLELGADPHLRYTYRSPVNGRVEASRTALMYAASASVAEILLSRGADPNVVDAAGETPLMLAAWRGDPQVVAVLLEAGADPRLQRPPTGRTATITARGLAEQKIAGWREMPSSGGISSRIEALEIVRSILLAAENRNSSSSET